MIEHGKLYKNARGDVLGPMDERENGVFLDQFGRLYHRNGRQWDHVETSTGNIVGTPIYVSHKVKCKMFPDPHDEREPKGPCDCGAMDAAIREAK